MKTMYGIITAMTTPFLTDGEVDFEALGQQMEFLIQSGVNCLYPCGTTGEMLFMTLQQRKAVAEVVVKQNAGRAIVFVQAGAVREEDTIELARHACGIGADGVGIVTPSFYNLTADEMANYYIRIARALPNDFSIYLYNIPQCTANDIAPEVCARIADACENVVGIKYSFCDMHRVLDYLRVRNGDLSVLIGFDRLLLPGLTIGCGGTVSGASAVFPEPFVAGYRAYQEGDFEEAEKQMWIADDVVKLLKAGSSLATFKAAQDLRGLPGGHVHAPLCDLSNMQKEELHGKIQRYLDAYPR